MANFEQANGGGGVLSLEPSLAAASAAEEAVRHHDWDKNDYKAFIKSQRAARTLQQQQQQQQHDDEGAAAFAFRNSYPTRRIRESCEEQHMKSMERDHHDSQAQMLYLDMDAALPLHWESLINTRCRSRRHSYSSSSSSSSSSSREFEFHMQQVQIRPEEVAAAEDAAAGDHHLHVGRDVVQGISHADELFYKGQLLPLHLRPRQQMVEKLTSEYSHVNQQEKAAATVAAAASDDHHAAALLDSSSYVKFCVNSCTDDLHVAAAAAAVLVDSRSSSFRSQSSSSSSYWESATAENSSSRDSNGSSQDACCFVNSSNNDNELQLLETQLSATTVGALGSKPPPLIKLSAFQKQKLQKQQESPFLHNREVFSTHMNCCKSAPSPDADQSTTKSTTSVVSSWLRPPFKWKVLFGVKKVSKTPTRKDQTTLERCNPLSTPESSYSSSSSSSSSACSPTSSYSAAADLVHSHAPDHPAPNKHSTSSSEADSSISSCEIRKSTAAREPAADEEESLRASAACSSAGAAAGEGSKTTREHQQQQHRWKKYIKMLKLPAYGKIMMQQQKQQKQQQQQQHIFDLVKIDFKNVAAATAASEPISSSNPAAAAASPPSSSRRAGSLSFIKPAAAAPPPPLPQAQKSLSGSLSFPSSFMMSPTSRMAAAAMGGGGVPGAPRRSSAHASDSTSNSGQLLLRPVFSQSSISDLQSSLQGAIAHCKQSHCAHI
jgi:hypothetical protein